MASSATAVYSPSRALAEKVKGKWKIKKIDIVPNVFIPSLAYLSIPEPQFSKRICFIGKLNVLKGMKALTDAIPFVLKKHTDAKFRFIGRDGDAPNGKGSMTEYIKNKLHQHKKKLEFIGYVDNNNIPDYLIDTDIIVLPSLWENYPYTCLEAMSAGRAIVGSKNGGMKEILQGMNGGILVNPKKSKEIANAIIWLLDHFVESRDMGNNNRQKMKTNCNHTIDRAETYYQKIITVNKTAVC